MLPNFICPGAQKSATTTFYDILRQHPDVFLPKIKEPHFFDDDVNYKNGLGWYEETFYHTTPNKKIAGDITPCYMFFEYVPERIYECLGPNVKIIFLLREPVERAFSNYLMNYRSGIEKFNFTTALELEEDRIQIDFKHKRNYSYFNRGLYSKQILNFINRFPKENMLFIRFEDFTTRTELVMKEVFAFLGLDVPAEINYTIHSFQAALPRWIWLRDLYRHPNQFTRELVKNIIPSIDLRIKIINFIDKLNSDSLKRPSLDIEIRNMLKELYREDIKELETIINIDLSKWLE